MSKIEWTGKTWNPIAGCSIVSPGCTNCYAMNMAHRIEAMGGPAHYAGLTKVVNGNAVWTGKVALAAPHILRLPLTIRKPTTWFVNSMSDLFHEDVPEDWIRAVFTTMAQARRHTFQVLTKRANRMREVLTRWERDGLTLREGKGAVLPNVWLGVSAERQQEANERVLDLIHTPAAVRFVSAEPLLGSIDFTRLPSIRFHDKRPYEVDALKYPDARLDWVIVGGESGHGARPMEREWADSIVHQCKSAGVAVFVKQLGAAFSDAQNGIAGASLKVAAEASNLISKRLQSRKGGDMAEWPLSLRVREMPSVARRVAA